MRAASLLVFLALAGSATAAAIGGGEEQAARASAVAAEGSFSFANSSDGMPIFSGTEIAPGDSASGTVEIANTGTMSCELVLTQHDVHDLPGLGGGDLSAQLALRVTDVTAPAAPLTVYTGPLAPMPPRPAGRVEPGASRTYEFVATLPETGSTAAQNGVQGASTSIAYSWTAGEATASPAPAPPTSPSPGQPPSSPPPPPAGTPPPAKPLRLIVTRVRRTLSAGHLLVWAHCDSACRISARGRLRARSDTGQRVAKLRPTHRSRLTAGTQRLRIRIPNRLRRWLATSPAPIRLEARLSLLASNPAGKRAAAHRAVRVRTHHPRSPVKKAP
jgi:hypothetical protein